MKRLPPRGANGRFRKPMPRRRNLDGTFYGGKFHPYRASLDYDGHLLDKPEYGQDSFTKEYARHSLAKERGEDYSPKRHRKTSGANRGSSYSELSEHQREENRRRAYGVARNPATGRFQKAKRKRKE